MHYSPTGIDIYNLNQLTHLQPTVLKGNNQSTHSNFNSHTLEAFLNQFIYQLSKPDYMPQAVQRTILVPEHSS